MTKLIKIFGYLVICLTLAGGNAFASVEEQKGNNPIFSIDFRKPEYRTSGFCIIRHDEGTEFNPTCGKSWKLDRYDATSDEFSYMEIEVDIEKDSTKEYALELLACARKDLPLVSNVTISVNDQVIMDNYHMYNGPDSVHFPDEQGKPSHLRWDVFEITKELHTGTNKIKISLDRDTQSGISMSWLHIRTN